MKKKLKLLFENQPLLLYVIASIVVSYIGYTMVAVSHAAVLFIMFPLAVSLFLIIRRKIMFHKGFYTVAVLVFSALILLSVFLNINRVKPDKSVFVISSALSVLLTASFLPYQEENSGRDALKIIASVYLLICFVLSVFGVFFGFSKIVIMPNIGYVVSGRLRLVIHENLVGMMMSLAVSFIYMFLLDWKNLNIKKKVFLILAAVTCYLTLVFTDCRTAKIALMLTTFVFAFEMIRMAKAPENKAVKYIIAAVAAAAACVFLWLMQSVIYSAIVSTVTTTNVTSNRAVAVDNDRLTIWRTAINGLLQDKQSILFGASPALAKDSFLVAKEDHFHNSYLAVLLNYGIFAFLSMCAIFAVSIVHMFRILFSKRRAASAENRYLVFVTLSILLMGMTEEIFVTSDFIQVFSIFLMVLTGYIYRISGSLNFEK